MGTYDILSDFSVIVQGKVFGLPGEANSKQLTLKCIDSVKRLLPNAEIILSTWAGTDVSHLKYDKVVFNTDPGAIAYSDKNPSYLNNTNRQILSTYSGLKAATKKYAIKLRGDCLLSNTAFLNFFQEYIRSPDLKFFKQRIIIPTKYSRNPRRIAQLIHPSDIFQVGLLEDLSNLWNIPLQPEPETTRAIPANRRIFNEALPGQHFRMKYGPEQYIWYAFCKKMGVDFELKHYSHIPISKIVDSELSIINNFIIADAEDIGVALPKRLQEHKFKDLYTYKEWQELYKKYCIIGISKTYKLLFIVTVYTNNLKMIILRMIRSLIYRVTVLFTKSKGTKKAGYSEGSADDQGFTT